MAFGSTRVAALSVALTLASGCTANDANDDQVLDDAEAGRVLEAGWLLREEPSDGLLPVKAATGGECRHEIVETEVAETDETVTLSFRVRVNEGLCDDSFEGQPVDIELDAPLGDRRLRGCEPRSEEAFAFGYDNPDCRKVDP